MLYEIWQLYKDKQLRMQDFLSVYPIFRDAVVSLDREKLELECQRLRACYGDCETTFEIRPIPVNDNH